ncbi:MAG: hypothetical protein U0W24_17700 [Bacteroidales bacterium]
MKFNITIYLTVLYTLFSLSLGCATSIAKIKKAPQKFEGKTIKVKGRVVSSLNLKDLKSFTIQGRTGNILVITNNWLPLKNDKITVKGQINTQFLYKDKTMLVVIENQLKQRKAPDARKKIRKI